MLALSWIGNLLVLAMAGMVLAQALMLALLLARSRALAVHLEQTVDRLERPLGRVLAGSRRLLATLRQMNSRIPRVQSTVGQGLETFVRQAEALDREVAKGLESARRELKRMDRELDSGVRRVSHETDRVHQAFTQPTMRISSLLQSAFRSLGRLLSPPGGPPRSRPEDEEGFI